MYLKIGQVALFFDGKKFQVSIPADGRVVIVTVDQSPKGDLALNFEVAMKSRYE